MNIKFETEVDQIESLMNANFKCPVCSGGYIHFNGAVLDAPGGDIHQAAAHGFKGRGDLRKLPFYCEEGHKFNLCFGEHKGVMSVYWERAEDKLCQKCNEAL